MSPIGSAIVMVVLAFLAAVPPAAGSSTRAGAYGEASIRITGPDGPGYQEAFETPGSSPRWAISRMQTRHSPNLRYTALGRPQRWQRVYARTANLGFAAALLISAFFAMGQLSLNGKPRSLSSARPSSSVLAVVTTVMSIPRVRSIRS